MHAEWSAECGADDPLIVVPWADPSGASSFVDLRAHPDAIDSIPEADAHPPLMQALLALNASRSPFFTAKCDAWEMSPEEVAQLRLDLMLDPAPDPDPVDLAPAPSTVRAEGFSFGFASYIDCVCRDRALFASFPRHEHQMRALTRLSTRLDHPHAAFECILRPSLITLKTPSQGWAITLYLKAVGDSPRKAYSAWSAALCDAVILLRSS